MQTPLLSVIVAAYKHGPYIEEAIRSIIGQDYPAIELIVIDDGSPDDTYAKVAAMAPACAARGIRFIHRTRPNKGLWETLNELVREATGEFVVRLDSDDFFLPGAFSGLMATLAGHPEAVAAVGDNSIVDAEGTRVFWDAERNTIRDPRLLHYATFRDFLRHKVVVGAPYGIPLDFERDFGVYRTFLLCGNHVPNGAVIRREALLRALPFSREAPQEDSWQWFQVAKAGPIVRTEALCLAYRWHEGNTIKQAAAMHRYKRLTWQKEIRVLCGLPAEERERVGEPGLPRVRLLGGMFFRYAFLRGVWLLRLGNRLIPFCGRFHQPKRFCRPSEPAERFETLPAPVCEPGETPRVSIVLLARGGDPAADWCAQTVLTQTFRDFEVLAIGTPPVALVGDARVRILQDEPAGDLDGARALGLAAARGELVCFLQTSEFFHPRFLECCVRALEGNGAAAFAKAGVLSQPEGIVPCEYTTAVAPGQDVRAVHGIAPLTDMGKAWQYPELCGFVFRRNALARVAPRGRLGEEAGFAFAVDLVRSGAAWLALPQALSFRACPWSATVPSSKRARWVACRRFRGALVRLFRFSGFGLADFPPKLWARVGVPWLIAKVGRAWPGRSYG